MAGLPFAESEKSLHLFASEVMPRLRVVAVVFAPHSALSG